MVGCRLVTFTGVVTLLFCVFGICVCIFDVLLVAAAWVYDWFVCLVSLILVGPPGSLIDVGLWCSAWV